MGKILHIYKTDLRSVIKSPALAILVIGMILLPSVYAWINIKSVWDPYNNTSGIPVAVANEDEGIEIEGKVINIGAQTIEGLKNNSKLGWKFVDYQEAERGVKYGDYYAYIFIPKDFSTKLTSIINANPMQPEIEFAVNEKINAIAPKIATSGASSLILQIRQSFTQTVSDSILSAFNKAGIQLQQDLPTIQNIENRVFELEAALPEIEEMGKQSIELEAKLPEIKQKAQKIIELKNRISELQSAGNSILIIESKLPNIEEAGSQIVELQGKVQEIQRIETIISEVENSLSSIEGNIKNAIDNAKTAADGQINILPNQQQLTAFQEELINIHKNIQTTRADLKQRIDDMIKDINMSADFIKNDLPSVETKIHKAADFVRNDLTKLEDDITRAADLVQNKFSTFESVVHKMADLSRNDLPGFEDKVKKAADKIRNLQSNINLSDLIDFLKIDPEKGSNVLADPILLNTKRIFPIPNYGSAMAALYNMLALWVGGTILISGLPVDVKNPEKIYKNHHIYFGRLLTFLTVGIFQALVMSLGNLFLLHTYVVNKLWFVLLSIYIGIVFVIITYTLRSVFGNIGSGMAMFFLVLQMSSSGATFPISMTFPIFQTISPFMPFTHAISILRETIGGMIVDIVIRNVLILNIFIIISFCLALTLKRAFSKEVELDNDDAI